MNRRHFLSAVAGLAASGAAYSDEAWQRPPRMARPELASEEGGLWALMNREEAKLRRSPFIIRNERLQTYIQQIACRLAGDHCPDVRVYIVRNRFFNANMAPNGMLQIWSGLLLRIDNEAQLAAVIGHEMGHYLEQHTLAQLRDVKARTAFGQFLGLFGVVGLIGQLGILAGAFSFSRDNERSADRIGLALMGTAGYEPREAAKIWQHLLLEMKARPDGDPAANNPLFATHPATEERATTLSTLAAEMPTGATGEETWQKQVAPFRREWLDEEIKRGQFEESLALLTRLIVRSPQEADFLWARGDVYRLHGGDTNIVLAIQDYLQAVALGREPPETYRGLGMAYRQQGRSAEAKVNFARYVERAPQAADVLMIKRYLEELGA